MHLSCIWNTSVLSHLKTLKGQQTGCITHLQCQCLKCMFAIILNSITTRLVQKNKKKQNWALSPSLTASVARWLGLKVWKLSLHLQEHNALNNIISLHLPHWSGADKSPSNLVYPHSERSDSHQTLTEQEMLLQLIDPTLKTKQHLQISFFIKQFALFKKSTEHQKLHNGP